MEIYNFDLPSQQRCFAPEENLEPHSAGLKSSRTRGVILVRELESFYSD